MATKKTKPVAIKASESVVAGLVAKILGVTAADNLAQVLDAARDRDAGGGIDYDFLSERIEFYPWLADVPAQMMAEKLGPLIEHVADHSIDVLWIVKDSFRGGTGGIWLVTAGFLPPGPWRGLFNTFPVGDDKLNLKAVQIESWMR
jgi:hypothetical protein